MEKFVPYDKLSKRRKCELDRARRTTWGAMSPVTKKKDSATIYNRKKHRKEFDDSGSGAFVM